MPLDEYRAKRDFTTSPEPAREVQPERRAGKRFFCVQKHLATQLHYDFRLEHGGVLLSWAVPKGPSLNPADKRFAAHVEDHPLEYGDFEGIIPEGYGAGIVMLWDRGTWEPEVEDVDAALARGDLKLRLDGYKLKGSWALVRTRGWGRSRAAGRDDGRSWLLIKHRDDWSGELDIAEFAPLSVKSGGDFEDILTADLPSFWTGNRAATRTATLEASLADIVAKLEKLQGRPVGTAPGAAAPGEPAPAGGRRTRASARKKSRG
jgi:bifunctional non-homologous end joining protein LigD